MSSESGKKMITRLGVVKIVDLDVYDLSNIVGEFDVEVGEDEADVMMRWVKTADARQYSEGCPCDMDDMVSAMVQPMHHHSVH